MVWGKREWLLLGGGVAAGAVVWYFRSFSAPVALAAGYAVNVFTRGQRLTHTSADADGVIQDDPEALVAAASAVMGRPLSPQAYALARMGRSEGVDGMEYRMHVALNDLGELRERYPGTYPDLEQLMIHSKDARSDGRFSAQGLGKRYATTRDPYEGDYQLALAVIADHGAGIDPTGGAVKFVDRDSFGVQEGTGSFDDLRERWAGDGLEASKLEGASDNFIVFRRTA
jgi:hypothetical protein